MNALEPAGYDYTGASQRRNRCILTGASHTPHRRQNQKAPALSGRGGMQCKSTGDPNAYSHPPASLWPLKIRVDVRSECPRELTNPSSIYPSINNSEMISVRRGRSRSKRPSLRLLEGAQSLPRTLISSFSLGNLAFALVLKDG